MEKSFFPQGFEPPSRQTAGMLRNHVNHLTSSPMWSNIVFILILKHLFIDRGSANITIHGRLSRGIVFGPLQKPWL